jgi:S1-C subfamily serine protease
MRCRTLAVVRGAFVVLVVGCLWLVSCSSSGGDDGARARAVATSAPVHDAPSGADVNTLAAVPDVARNLEPSVVTIITASGLGSGVIYRSDGTIVTNAHVVGSATRVQVAFADGGRARGTVQATDRVVDLAVVHVARTGLPAARFETDLPDVGELAIAVGSPLGFAESVTAGVVSGLHRTLAGGAEPIVDVLQTDAPISPGNSGGALADGNGKVIGITEAYVPPSQGAVSIGFAIPAATVVDDVGQLIRNGRAAHAFLGVQPADISPAIAREFGISAKEGAAVLDVAANGPAAIAGIRAGDVITRIGRFPVHDAADLFEALRKLQPGQHVDVMFLRDGEHVTRSVTLADRPPS